MHSSSLWWLVGHTKTGINEFAAFDDFLGAISAHFKYVVPGDKSDEHSCLCLARALLVLDLL